MMARKLAFFIFLFIAFPVAFVQADFPIAQNSQLRAVIVVHKDDSEQSAYAAQQLAQFLNQITKADFQVVNKPHASKNNILVGPKAAGISVSSLGSDGIIIRTDGDNLILAGNGPRGTIYAVFTFLEDIVGCRWWSSKANFIPSSPTLNVGDIDMQYVPTLEYRESFWSDAFDGDWAVRNKCNGNSHRLTDAQGGRHIYQGFVHTFYSLIPPATYFKDHPEWYSEINGKRLHQHKQLCLTNDQMKAELIKNLKARLRNNPAATIASVSQNDWHGYCTCAKCDELDKKEGSPAGSLLHFVNAVAEDIEDEFPHVAISTLAYQYTRKPPRLVKPRPNVIVRLCSIECSFSKPLEDERNKTFRDDIVGWSKICNRLYIWDYVTNFRHYFRPHPNLRVLGPNIRFFADHGVKGIFEQGAYTSVGAEMAELRAWVLAKLLWDPKLDDDKLIDEFLGGYYGPAAKHIRQYLDVIHDAVDESGYYLGCLPSYNEPRPGYLNFTTLNRGWNHLKAAETAVSDSPQLLNRVKVAQLPVMYVFMRQWRKFHNDAQKSSTTWPMHESIENAYEDFMEVAKKNNVTRLNEWNNGFGLLDEAVKNAKR